MNQWVIAIILQAMGLLLRDPVSAMTMDQFTTSLDTLRAGCAPKFKIEPATLDRLRMGDFSQEATQDVMTKTTRTRARKSTKPPSAWGRTARES
ncbi:Odorant-binding protein 76a, isoform B [Drosophila ananassae]|uniref:Odorant-binding protein 76a, isoform B n=1 Tax=Drosophila ananassae TaxID=7217 RepID=A0A0P9C514_DROAN|nr:Odorant-binding protein 76a, isoform B [Drosophila ananassae]